jgi:hypothetical protein
LIAGGHRETRRNWEVRKSRMKMGCEHRLDQQTQP